MKLMEITLPRCVVIQSGVLRRGWGETEEVPGNAGAEPRLGPCFLDCRIFAFKVVPVSLQINIF